MSEKIEIYTDGSSLGNPGHGGWGVVIIINNYELRITNEKKGKQEIIELGGYEKNTTNNRMEIKAVIEALKYICVRQDLTQDKEVALYADSSYVLGGVITWVGNWEKNGWKTANKKQVLNQDLWQELIALVREFGARLTFVKVKGHADIEHNIRADEIATNSAALQQFL